MPEPTRFFLSLSYRSPRTVSACFLFLSVRSPHRSVAYGNGRNKGKRTSPFVNHSIWEFTEFELKYTNRNTRVIGFWRQKYVNKHVVYCCDSPAPPPPTHYNETGDLEPTTDKDTGVLTPLLLINALHCYTRLVIYLVNICATSMPRCSYSAVILKCKKNTLPWFAEG